MTNTLKRWSQLGLGVALASGTLAACTPQEDVAETSETEIATATSPIETEEPTASEAGEGEGGVVFSQAVGDPVVFLSILAITEAHIIAARDAHALGENAAAAEMFAHPVSEVLFESQDVFTQLGVADFSDKLTETSAAVLAGETPEQINARADDIIADLRAASEKSPTSDASLASVAAGVAVDQIERAADMYRIALESDAYEPYLDGYGFLKAGEAVFLESADAIEAEDKQAASAIRNAIAKLGDAYPSAVRPETLDADLASVTVAASNAIIAVQN
ncbi:MAG: hypothetical protein AAFQ12_06650 [Pseudomonadota bacterium]